jgi:hypothetical protein
MNSWDLHCTRFFISNKIGFLICRWSPAVSVLSHDQFFSVSEFGGSLIHTESLFRNELSQYIFEGKLSQNFMTHVFQRPHNALNCRV